MDQTQAKPFAFRRRFERVDWRKLASVNLDQIARDLDFDALQENLTNIAFCNVELELDLRLIDPNFVKLFRLAQLTIEYLLYSQEYLSETIMGLEGRITEQNKNDENMSAKLKMVEKELERIKKEGHKRKKLIMDQQHLIESGADNFHKCLLCPKAFMNATFLQNHCVRRHGQTLQDIKNAHGDDKENEIPPKISEQLQEIKERLIFTESQLAEERKSMKERDLKDSSLLADRDAEHLRKLEEWTEVSKSQHKQEIERIQKMLMVELKEMQEKQSATQKALEAAQQGLSSRASNLGTSIHDDIEVEREREMLAREREKIQREREEMRNLQEEIKQQKDSMQDLIESKFAEREAKRDAGGKMNGVDIVPQARTERSSYQEQRSKERKARRRPVSPSVLKSGPVITNGRPQDAVEDTVEKKKKFLTFADDTNGRDSESQNGMVEKISTVSVPEIRELPPTESTLSSEEESEEGDSTLRDATTTMQSMSTLGSLDLTGKSKELGDALLQNPNLMQDMKDQLQQVINSELLRWDVHPDSEGLSSTKLATKLQHLSQERSKNERKYKTFRETRSALISKVDELAKAEVARSASKGLVPQAGYSPKDSKRLTGTMSSMTATMESSTWGTTSSKWTSSDRREQVPDLSAYDESSSEDDDPLPSYKSKTPSPTKAGSPDKTPQPTPQPRSGSKSEQARVSSDWGAGDEVDDGGFAPPPKGKQPIQIPDVEAEDYDSDSDGLSEYSDIGEGRTATPLKSPGGGAARGGGVVANLAANLESQLLQRTGKAPAGGINTLQIPSDDTRSPTTPDIPNMDGSDDDFSISSVEAQLMPNAGTNTYSSRQWGQGTHSSAANTLTGSGRPGGSFVPSADKASSVTSDNASLTSVTGTAQKGDSGSDWSADSDFDNL